MTDNRRRTMPRLCKLAVAGALFWTTLAGTVPASADSPATLPSDSLVSALARQVALELVQGYPAELEKSVDAWIQSLSARQPFAAWKRASRHIEPLGPGTHGWLVTLRSNAKQPVGYLVVYAAEDGSYRLGEYGVGPQPLFDKASLSRSLVANGIISSHSSPYRAEKQYLHPFAAVWKVTVGGESYWFDAKTDEQLPLDDKSWERIREAFQGLSPEPDKAAAVSKLKLGEPFDPYERLPWLMNEAPFDADDDADFVARVGQGHPLRYVCEPFGDKMLYAIAVVGYAGWSGGRIDAALEMYGSRFVPLSTLRSYGLFYR